MASRFYRNIEEESQDPDFIPETQVTPNRKRLGEFTEIPTQLINSPDNQQKVFIQEVIKDSPSELALFSDKDKQISNWPKLIKEHKIRPSQLELHQIKKIKVIEKADLVVNDSGRTQLRVVKTIEKFYDTDPIAHATTPTLINSNIRNKILFPHTKNVLATYKDNKNKQ